MTEQTPVREYGPDDIKRFTANYKDEVDGASLYRLLADAEKDHHLK